MAPHAVMSDSSLPSSRSLSVASRDESTNASRPHHSPHLRRVPNDHLHDLVCIGFGPASLAIAVALHDAVDGGLHSSSLPKVAFLERQPQFAWHSGMQIPGAKMQISFLKDMATMRDPRSHFTFVNYLHQNHRLGQFSNLGTFLPRRIEYEDYMRWCAAHFSEVVSYGQQVLSVEPDLPASSAKPVRSFTVTSRDTSTGQTSAIRAKHVLIAVGGRPKIPQNLPQRHPRVVHSSGYRAFLNSGSLDASSPLRIAVIGGGQSAAEIFSDLPSSFPNSKSYLLIKSPALKPSDDSPFVNEVFDPERVDGIYATPAEARQAAIRTDKATNYGVVRTELLEHIYEELYTQRITHGNSPDAWPRRILSNTLVNGVEEDTAAGSLTLALSSTAPSEQHRKERLEVDLVFVASGYERDMHETMLAGCHGLLPATAATTESKAFDVRRDYSVKFDESKVGPDAGVWLQGCNEATHGLSDTLLSILAVRAGEIVESIFGGGQ